MVATRFSVISAGTEQALSRIAGKSLVGKARDRPDQARKVLDKALREGAAATLASVRARLEDLMTPGYSSMGVVEQVGEGVEGLRPGQRVGCVGADAACHAQRVAVPSPLCLPLPDALDDRYGAFGALGGIAAHGVRVARVDAGSVVAVIGLGLVGQIAAQLVTAAGGRVVGIDPAADRVALAQRLGAVGGAVLGTDDPEAPLRSVSHGHGADAVLVCAATSDSSPVELAARLARDRATVSVVGDVGLELSRAAFFEKELELRVSRSYGPGRYDPSYENEGRDYPVGYVRWTERRLIGYFFEEVAAGRVQLDELITHEFPIERGTEAYAALSDESRLAILLSYGEEPPKQRDRATVRVPGPVRSDRLKVGIVGPGVFARSTLLPLLSEMDVDLVGVAGPSSARALAAARRFDGSYAATDPNEVIEDDAVDVVVIATQHDSHAELAARALERGKGVFLEKPMAIDDRGVERLRPLLDAGGRLVVDFNRSLAPSTESVASHLTNRSEPVYLDYRVNAGYLPSEHWLRNRERGGGRLVGEGCHFVDLCSRLVGRPVTSVQVSALGAGPRTLAGDNFSLTLRYEDGSLATVAYVSSGDAGLAKERLEVLGSGRAAVLEDYRRVDLFRGGRRRRKPPSLPIQDKGHEAILRAALDFFRKGGSPPVPYERLLETTCVTLRGRDALDRGDSAPISLQAV